MNLSWTALAGGALVMVLARRDTHEILKLVVGTCCSSSRRCSWLSKDEQHGSARQIFARLRGLFGSARARRRGISSGFSARFERTFRTCRSFSWRANDQRLRAAGAIGSDGEARRSPGNCRFCVVPMSTRRRRRAATYESLWDYEPESVIAGERRRQRHHFPHLLRLREAVDHLPATRTNGTFEKTFEPSAENHAKFHACAPGLEPNKPRSLANIWSGQTRAVQSFDNHEQRREEEQQVANPPVSILHGCRGAPTP